MFDKTKPIVISETALDELALMAVRHYVKEPTNPYDLFEKFLYYRSLYEMTKMENFYDLKSPEDYLNDFLKK